MRCRVIGGGWYGCHIALALIEAGHEVELHEMTDRLFAGASGANPARLHKGFHYPRSRLTRAACLDHADDFMARYGHLTQTIPCNVYAVASEDSLVDWGTYRQVLRGEVEFVELERPADMGLQNLEGAMLTGERHIVIDDARAWFEGRLGEHVSYNTAAGKIDDPRWDLTIDCSFCANDAEAIDRYEPCLTVILEGPTSRGLTVMDGPFPSLIPHNEAKRTCSLTSAKFTPLSKTCRTYGEARQMLREATAEELATRACDMLDQISLYWPAARDLFTIVDLRTAIRAMPRSGADARLVDVVQVGERALRIRAGKIDAVFRAEALVLEQVAQMSTRPRAAA